MGYSLEVKPWQKYLVLALFAIGIWTRLFNLGEKAFHHDESIHAFYSYQIATEGRFKGAANKDVTFGYNPVYHGPFLYHIGGLFFFLFGDNDFTARLPHAVTGIFLLWLVWEVRRLVGVPMALGMLGAVVLSPIVNYYSRFCREDVYVGVAFFATAVYAGLYLREKRSVHLLLASFFLIIGYATKESSYIYGFSLGFFAVAWGIIRAWRYGASEIATWFRDYHPFLVLLTLYGCFSCFVFLFVAVDYRVDPKQYGFIGGVFHIIENAFIDEKLAAEESGQALRAKIQAQTRFFTDKDRSFAMKVYLAFAFIVTGLLLAALEFLRHRFCVGDAAAAPDNKAPPKASSTSGADPNTPVVPLLLCGILLFFWVLLLFVSIAKASLLTFLFGGLLWIAFEVVRRDYLDPAGDDPKSPRLFRIAAPWLTIASCLAVIVSVYVFLFSQMFADFPSTGRNGLQRGLYDYIEYWFGHQLGEYRLWGPWWFYLARLLVYEFAFLIVGFFGTMIVLGWTIYKRFVPGACNVQAAQDCACGPFNAFMAFVLWSALFNTYIYAKLHEKAPWLAFHQALPWALLAGGLVGWAFFTWRERWIRTLLLIVLLPLGALEMKSHLQVNHIHADNNAELVSQQQADRDIRDMVKLVDHWAAETGLYEEFPIASEDQVEWPFPWYFRNYKNYRVKTADPKAMVQFGDDSTFQEMRAKLGEGFVWRKYLHRSAWIENSMDARDLPGGTSLIENIRAYLNDDRFKGKSFRYLFWNYFFHRERWSDVNPKWGYAYFKKDMLPALEPIDLPDGTLDRPRPLAAELALTSPKGGETRFNTPRGMTVDPSGNLHLVDSLNGRVLVMNAEGEQVRTYGFPGAGKGQFKVEGGWGPSSVALDGGGNAYVTDTWNNRIIKFDPQGNPLVSWGNDASNDIVYPNLFFFPRAVAVGPDGNIYVADTGHHEIKVFDSEGKRVRTVGQRGISRGQLDEPVGLKFDAEGNLYVCDTGNERIQIFRPNGSVKDAILVPGWSADKVGMEPFIDLLPDGRIVVSLSKKKMFRVYQPDGQSAVNYTIDNGEPIGVAVDGEGRLWVGDRIRNQIFRVKVP